MSDSTIKSPQSLERIIDVKGLYLSIVANSVDFLSSGEIEQFQFGRDTKLIILTHSAAIVGRPFHFPTEDEYQSADKVSLALKTFFSSIDNVLNQYVLDREESIDPSSIQATNVSHVIHLEDVEVKPFANPQTTMRFPHLAVFAGEIVGITFGEYPEG